METSLHRHDVFMAQFAEDKFSAVSLYGRDGEIGDFFVPYLILFSDFTGKTAESVPRMIAVSGWVCIFPFRKAAVS